MPWFHEQADAIPRKKVEELCGRTLEEAREWIAQELKQERATYDRIVRAALVLGGAIARNPTPAEIYIEGSSKALEQPEFADPSKVRELLRALDDKTALLDLLERTLSKGGLTVSIGSENTDARLAGLVDAARSEVLINAFSFTNRRMARALGAAHARGVRVEIVADRIQTLEFPGSAIPALARSGIAVWLDGNFAAAHNKVMIIDGASVRGAVVTGSFNYTSAAQSRNAENVLIVRHDPSLASQYRANFLRLRDRAQRYDGASWPRR